MNRRIMHPKLAMDSVVRGVSILQERALHGAGVDLTTQQATVAVVLLERGAQPVHQLSSTLEINQSAMTRLIDRLESKDVARRSRSSGDGRVVNVALTSNGAEAAVMARKVIDDLKHVLLADIDSKDLDAYWRVLKLMRTTVAERIAIDPQL